MERLVGLAGPSCEAMFLKTKLSLIADLIADSNVDLHYEDASNPHACTLVPTAASKRMTIQWLLLIC